MINKVISTVNKYEMLSDCKTVVAAVSGGSDSMAMLFILQKLREVYGYKLIAAHVNHGIRGEQADADECFVVDYCTENGIEVNVLKADVIAEAERFSWSLEEAGRKIRYEFFASFGKDVLVATAHNATDRVETFLFNFARGSALRGLGSIPPVRDNFIRPLIDCSKAEIESFCEENCIPFIIDATNSDVCYSRNRIRHNVLTELRAINPSLEASASRCIDALREDEHFLSGLADGLVYDAETEKGYDASVLNNAPISIKKRAVIRIVETVCGVTPERTGVDEICSILANGGSRQINGGILVRVRCGMLEFPNGNEPSFETVPFSLGSVRAGNSEIVSEILKIKDTNCLQKVSKSVLTYYLDYDKIHGNMLFRCRESGDKISLKNRGCTKTLKKLFNELSIAPEKRNNLVILSDDAGVLLVEGVGVDSRVEPDENTSLVLAVKINR